MFLREAVQCVTGSVNNGAGAKPLRILLVHNRYQQAGGEDHVFSMEGALLEKHGHEVTRLVEDNQRIRQDGIISIALGTIWNHATYRNMGRLLRLWRPHVVHVHNTFPLLSPSVYHVVKRSGVPVVQTLHNYRLLCLNALLHRSGQPCDDCMGKFVPWLGIVHRCYRDSYAGSAVVAAMLVTHRFLKTWHNLIDVYIALTEVARQQFIRAGLPGEKIVVKPNFVAPDPGERNPEHVGDYALFVGRLSAEKGVKTLLKAWRLVHDVPLKIVGDGPLREDVLVQIRQNRWEDRVEWLGRRSRAEVFQLMKEARVLIVPSEWYESFPLTIVEAFASGLPVIGSRIGAIQEVVQDGRTGLHFNPGDPADLAAKIAWAYSHPVQLKEMGREARREFEVNYTAERNYELLMDIYRLAVQRAQTR